MVTFRGAITIFFLLLILAFLVGCTEIIKEVDSSLPAVPTPDAVAPQPTPQPFVQSLPYMTKEQSKFLLDELRLQMPKLKVAEYDMNARFCPKYYTFNDEQKLVAWAYLANAIVQFESGTDDGFIKRCTKSTEKTGQQSIGFFQLSYGDTFCPASKEDGDLCDAKVNITCAAKLIGKFVAEDRVIADGGYVKYGAKSPKGLAQYWSVVRVPDTDSKHHLQDIMDKTKKAPGCI